MNSKRIYNIHIIFVGLILIMFIFENFFREIFLRELSVTGEAFPKVWQFFSYAFYTGLNITKTGFSQFSVLWFIFHVLIAFWFGRMLENYLGSLKFTLFLILTILGESIVVYMLGEINILRLFGIPIYFRGLFDLSFMMMFGLTYPQEKIYLFFVLRIRVLFLAIFYYLWYLFGLFQIWNRSIDEILMILAIFSGSSLGIFVFKLSGLIFNKMKIKTNKIVNDVKNKKTLSKAEKDYEFFNKIKKKFEIEKALSKEEEKYLENLYLLSPISELCSKEDFEPETEHCMLCENFNICIRRFLEDYHYRKG